MGASKLYSSKKWLFALLAAWVGFGLIGHDPWKPDEAYTFGLVYHIVQSGDWLVPTLAGEPFVEKPPLFFVTAALFAQLFGGLLPRHDAARLASGFSVAMSLLFTGFTAR
jgi:4-amino-4-deoxy-L-arabinose transferase-like glycosyltransferase